MFNRTVKLLPMTLLLFLCNTGMLFSAELPTDKLPAEAQSRRVTQVDQATQTDLSDFCLPMIDASAAQFSVMIEKYIDLIIKQAPEAHKQVLTDGIKMIFYTEVVKLLRAALKTSDASLSSTEGEELLQEIKVLLAQKSPPMEALCSAYGEYRKLVPAVGTEALTSDDWFREMTAC